MTGRPRGFDRDAAVDTALAAFWAGGYQGTSVAQLTARIGIRPPSLYAAFGDKEGLFAEAAARYTDRLLAGLADSLCAPTARQAIRQVLDATAWYHTRPDTPPGCLVLSEPQLTAERGRVREMIADRIEQGRREGDVPPHVDPVAHASYLEAVMVGMSARAREGGTRAQVAAIASVASAAWPADGG